ncbi:hypothetical protein OG884_02865 [Streptosporangium sp. NBC_01755]|uniref:hypothetical protein n=1 Tax=Streptosporangium sp. NBC_01755 TaxID=2975949 RepID=UPI002DD966F0|nr:hypothetical protein [Streptosporangium sp. NBC_01755]WSD00897.1 hypothetical protein OG884_02865 [Streptosporangium sp. NBC_01755]
MSEVVPLPSFGEVFFDERGQERVLRVTWHEGTLVLSLWRGEMCTASFRMPMNDVGRLVDTLDEGFVQAGGQYPDEVGEPVHAEQQIHGDYPGTGQYARPRPEDYAQPQQYADPAGHVPVPDEPRQVATLGPNDVLVARGVVPPLDRPDRPDWSQDRMAPGYGSSDAVPRENMIVNDSLSYGQPQSFDPLGTGPVSGEAAYQMPGDHYPPAQQPAPYGAPQPDPYAVPASQPDPYGTPAPQPADRFGVQQPDPYDVSLQQRPVDPFAPHAEQFPNSARRPDPDPYGQGQQSSTDPFGFAAQQQAAGHGTPQPDPYGYPAPAQPDPYAFGTAQPHQAGHPADLRDLYGSPPVYPQQDVDPSDPLGLGGQSAPDQRLSRPYLQDPPHSTGERLRPEQGHDDRYDRRRDEHQYDDRRREGRRRGDRGDRGERGEW